MNRKAKVMINDIYAGIIEETDSGYEFTYTDEYYFDKSNLPVSLTFPLISQKYKSNVLFPFFDGLIPEGWLLRIAEQNWKINHRDRMGLLIACCRDCIGAVSIIPEPNDD